ncbi:hypothetical protein GF325_01805, partial [Candidatus Bathyarchaeota archaeon]|nr:hypothetical protein [Candidatus Bathyarchaeota archaeon]
GKMAGQLMGAEMIGEKYDADRETLDKFSLWSHEKANKYKDLRHKETIPIEVPYIGEIKGETNVSVEVKPGVRSAVKRQKCKLILADNDYPAFNDWKDKLDLEGNLADNVKHFTYDIDESGRTKTTMEMMSKMRGAVKRRGILTAGNSCPENDGASGMLLASREAAEQLGLNIRGHIKHITVVGSCPVLMLTGPQKATKLMMKRHGYSLDDFDIIEVNEAFSTVVDGFCKDVGLDMFDERINPWGGAIAVGHPTGSTGCRLIGTLLHQFEEKNAKDKLGLATLCVGLGMGIAGVVQLE